MVLENLNPAIVWNIFEHIIVATPRPSQHENKIRNRIKEWIIDQVKKKGIDLELFEDKVGNILIKKAATPGMEFVPSLLLQGHLDMVCETNRPEGYDFYENGIPIRIQENKEWVDADGTTLGADNGIGVAFALAILIDTEKNTKHGPIEVLLTVNEEAGFTGAINLDPKTFGIKSKYMINLDSGPIGEIIIGSVCGRRVKFTKNFKLLEQKSIPGLTYFELTVNGLLSGHSGGDIHLPRGNANKLVNRILSSLTKEMEIYLCGWNGGTRTNVIPLKSTVKLAIKSKDEEIFQSLIKTEISTIFDYYKTNKGTTSKLEPDIEIILKEGIEGKFLSNQDTNNIISMISIIPHGALRFSPFYENFVETSNNLAIITTENNMITIWLYPRSIIRTELDVFIHSMIELAEMGNWDISLFPVLPEWIPKPQSRLLQYIKNQYEPLSQNPIKVSVVHGGLETGMISKKIPGIEMVSLGPTIEGEHSPSERLKIRDVEIMYELLIRILRNFQEIEEKIA